MARIDLVKVSPDPQAQIRIREQLEKYYRQLEKEINAAGSGVIVDAQKGYVLTASHVVAQASTVQIKTKDGRKFAAKLVGRDAPTDVALLQIKDPTGLSLSLGRSSSATAMRLRSATLSLPSAIPSVLARPSRQDL